MFENATHLYFQPEVFDKAVLTVREFVVPVIRKQRGLLGLALIPEKGTGRLTILSLWESRLCALAIEVVREYRQGIRRLEPFLLRDEDRPVEKPFMWIRREMFFCLN